MLKGYWRYKFCSEMIEKNEKPIAVHQAWHEVDSQVFDPVKYGKETLVFGAIIIFKT
jgi:hypothetical protein